MYLIGFYLKSNQSDCSNKLENLSEYFNLVVPSPDIINKFISKTILCHFVIPKNLLMIIYKFCF